MRGKRGRVIWAVAGAVAVACLLVGAAVVARVGDARDDETLESQLVRTEARAERLRLEVADLEAARASDAAEVAAADAVFAPALIAAIEQTRLAAVRGACDVGRAAARERQAVPSTEGMMTLVLAGAEVEHAVLATVDGWSDLVDRSAADAEVVRCHSDEATVIAEEDRVAEEARLAAEEAQRQADEQARQAAEQGSAEDPTATDSPTPSDPARCSSGASCERGWNLDTCEGFLGAVQSAGRLPTSGEVQYLWMECGIDYTG